MKTFKILPHMLIMAAMVLLTRAAGASLYSFTEPSGGGSGTYTAVASGLNQLIPDNSLQEGVGYGFSFTANDLSISALTLSLDMSGGINGDMYGYLQHDGTLIELFNPSSFSANGANGSTLNVFLSSGSSTSLSGATDIQLASGLTFAASGNLNNFATADPNGLWTLYFADESPGDQMTLNSFNLSITAVPEPASAALVISGGVIGFLFLRRSVTVRK